MQRQVHPVTPALFGIRVHDLLQENISASLASQAGTFRHFASWKMHARNLHHVRPRAHQQVKEGYGAENAPTAHYSPGVRRLAHHRFDSRPRTPPSEG